MDSSWVSARLQSLTAYDLRLSNISSNSREVSGIASPLFCEGWGAERRGRAYSVQRLPPAWNCSSCRPANEAVLKSRVSISALGQALFYKTCRWSSNSRNIQKRVLGAPRRPTMPISISWYCLVPAFVQLSVGLRRDRCSTRHSTTTS